ncbi:MAG TPA: hypothetical protein VKH40_01640 [Alloacidobacterium sp.]|nr:hypothetical protein [Alloacidobacterium sp.]
MPKTYISKALTVLSKRREGSYLCDKIAHRLSNMTSGSVRRVNNVLDFGWLKWTMMNVQLMYEQTREQLADLRRAAMLGAMVFELSAELKRKAENWDMGQFTQVFRACEDKPNYPARGFYLKGSFWGFANHSQREWTEQAWMEAGRLVGSGLHALNVAAADHNEGYRRFNYSCALFRPAESRRCQKHSDDNPKCYAERHGRHFLRGARRRQRHLRGTS